MRRTLYDKFYLTEPRLQISIAAGGPMIAGVHGTTPAACPPLHKPPNFDVICADPRSIRLSACCPAASVTVRAVAGAITINNYVVICDYQTPACFRRLLPQVPPRASCTCPLSPAGRWRTSIMASDPDFHLWDRGISIIWACERA